MPKISIVVPIYNAEKYISRCIDSILRQTMSDFELLLVNDGSKDRSGIICQDYSLKDNRIRVFNQENGGVSSARCLGVNNAQGEWITFVDSDDWITDNMLEGMSHCISSEFDIIVTASQEDRIISPSEYVREILMYKIPPQVWGKLYKRSILKSTMNLSRDLLWGEDFIANVRIGLNAQNRIILKKECLYNYSINDTSISFNRNASYEYEEFFLKVLESKMGYENTLRYQKALTYTKFFMLEHLIVSKKRVNYDDEWVRETMRLGKEQSLPIRFNIILYIKNNILCRYVLALERKCRKWCDTFFRH